MADGPASRRPLDHVFDVLRSPDRRRLLVSLATADDDDLPLSLEATAPPDRHDGDYQLYMRHTHLPKLVDDGYVHYDPAGDLVRPGPRFEEVAGVIEVLSDNVESLPGDFP